MTASFPDGERLKSPLPSNADWQLLTSFGAILLIAGILGGESLLAAEFSSVLNIAAAMIIGGMVQIGFAFTAPGWEQKPLWILGGTFYALAGAICFASPTLVGESVSICASAMLFLSGITRIASAIADHKRGKTLAVFIATGLVTIAAGIVVLPLWPDVTLWLLGALLSVDLVVQGLSTVGLGLALRER